MNFGFSEEQELLRQQVARFMQEACPMSRVRQIMAREDGFDGELWRQVAELGWLGLIIPEEFGGVGLKWVDLTVVLEETARGLCPLPIASQALSAAAILRLGRDVHRREWLPAMARGDAICTLGLYDEPNWLHPDAVTLSGSPAEGGLRVSGRKPFVQDAMAASHFLLALRGPEGLALAALGREQVTVQRQPQMDRSKPMGCVSLDGVLVPDEDLLPLGDAELSTLSDLGAVAVVAEMVGAAEAALQLTSDYAKERMQFGKPIGQYQGVKHRLADMFVDTESFKSLAYYAAWAADDAPQDLPRAVSLAKGYASDAFAGLAIDAIGLHGAIGFTAEYDAQLYLKRSKWARPMYGDAEFHLDRVARFGGL